MSLENEFNGEPMKVPEQPKTLSEADDAQAADEQMGPTDQPRSTIPTVEVPEPKPEVGPTGPEAPVGAGVRTGPPPATVAAVGRIAATTDRSSITTSGTKHGSERTTDHIPRSEDRQPQEPDDDPADAKSSEPAEQRQTDISSSSAGTPAPGDAKSAPADDTPKPTDATRPAEARPEVSPEEERAHSTEFFFLLNNTKPAARAEAASFIKAEDCTVVAIEAHHNATATSRKHAEASLTKLVSSERGARGTSPDEDAASILAFSQRRDSPLGTLIEGLADSDVRVVPIDLTRDDPRHQYLEHAAMFKRDFQSGVADMEPNQTLRERAAEAIRFTARANKERDAALAQELDTLAHRFPGEKIAVVHDNPSQNLPEQLRASGYEQVSHTYLISNGRRVQKITTSLMDQVTEKVQRLGENTPIDDTTLDRIVLEASIAPTLDKAGAADPFAVSHEVVRRLSENQIVNLLSQLDEIKVSYDSDTANVHVGRIARRLLGDYYRELRES
jgi:hypothetical protein